MAEARTKLKGGREKGPFCICAKGVSAQKAGGKRVPRAKAFFPRLPFSDGWDSESSVGKKRANGCEEELRVLDV